MTLHMPWLLQIALPVHGLILMQVAPGSGAADAPPPAIEVPDFGDRVIHMLWLTAGLVIVLFAAARLLPWFLRRASGGALLLPGGAGRRIQVIERVRLDARKSLCLVRVAGRYLLLGVSDQRIDVLDPEGLDQEALRALEGASGGERPGHVRSAFAADLLRRVRKEGEP